MRLSVQGKALVELFIAEEAVSDSGYLYCFEKG